MGVELLLLSLLPCIMAFYWFLLLCMAPSTSVTASDVLCEVQSPLVTPYFTPWLTLPRPAFGCSSPSRLGLDDASNSEVHVLHLKGSVELASDDVEDSLDSSTTRVTGITQDRRPTGSKASSGRNKQKPFPASNLNLPPVDVTMNGLWWDWGNMENGTPATLPPPVSLSTLVLFLSTEHPVRWRLHTLALPETSKIIIQVNEDSLVESNLPAQILKANWLSKDDLLKYVHKDYAAITSFTEVDGANQVSLKVGYATADFKTCNTSSSKKSSVVSASKAIKQKTEGCFHENKIGFNPWDVYVVELSPNMRRKNEREGDWDGSVGGGKFGSSTTSPRPPSYPVAVLLEGEGPVPVPRNVTLVLKSRAPIRWRFGSTGVEGSIVVVSNQEVENWGTAAAVASMAGGVGAGRMGFGLKKSSGLEVRSQILPDNMNALLVQITSEFGPPVLYAKTKSASTLRLLVGNGRNTKSSVTKPPHLNRHVHSNHPVPVPSHSSGSSLSWLGSQQRNGFKDLSSDSRPGPWGSENSFIDGLHEQGIEPSADKDEKTSHSDEGKGPISRIALLQKAMSVDCERKRVEVSFPRYLADSLGVTFMAFNDRSCTWKQNSSHYSLSTLMTSCGSTSGSDGKITWFSNSVSIKFGPAGSDDEDFAGPSEDGGGSELGSGAYGSESDLFEGSPNQIPVRCHHPPMFPGSGFGPMSFDDTSSLDTVDMSGGSSSNQQNKLYHMEVYRDSNHTMPVDFNRDTPAEVAFDETLHVKTWIDGVFPIQVVTENCWVSNSSDPNRTSRVPLIRNTCPVDLSVAIEEPSGDTKNRKPPHGGFSFQVNNEYGHLGNLYVHCRLGVCTPDAAQARGNLVLCVEPHQYCQQSLRAFLDKTVSTAQQLATRGPLRPVPKRRTGKTVASEGGSSTMGKGRGLLTGSRENVRLSPTFGSNGVHGDVTGVDDVSAIAGEALSPNQRIPQQVLVVGISTEVAVGIALASFAIGVGLTTSLWCIHLHTDPFRSRRRSNKHLVQVVGVPGGTSSILCEGGGSSGGAGVVIGGVGGAGGTEGCNLSPHSGCSTTNSQATIAT